MNQFAHINPKLKVKCQHFHMNKCYRNIDKARDCKALLGKSCTKIEPFCEREEFEAQENTEEINEGQINLLI